MRPTRSYDVYIDGASRGNPGPAGAGAVFVDGQRIVRQFGRPLGQTTNNVAEYLALIYALQEALRAGYRQLTVKTDSELLARQMAGRYRVRDEQLRVLHEVARHLVEGFTRCEIRHIPREENTAADRLAGQAAREALRSSGGDRQSARATSDRGGIEQTLFGM